MLEDLGASATAVQRRIAAGMVVRSDTKGIYHQADSEATWERRLWTLYLAAGHGRYVSRQAAGALHGLPSFGRTELSVTVPHGQHQLCHPGQIHQTRRPWPDEFLVVIEGLTVTDPAATIVDVAGLLRPRRLLEVVESAQHDLGTPISRIGRAHKFADYANRPGRLRLMAVLDRLAAGDGMVQSKLERIFHETAAELGFEPWTPQFPHPGRDLSNARGDAGDARAKVIAEMDSRTWHSRNRDRLRDAHRDRTAAMAGYQVVRVLGEELLRDPVAAVREVEAIRQMRLHQLGAA